MKYLGTLQNNVGANVDVDGHTHTKAEVGLGSVDNTADANKNVASATKFQEVDRRSTNENPQYYMSIGKGVVYEFKTSATISLTSVFSEVPTYSEVTTYISWGDPSGGYPLQVATNNTGMYYRIGTSTTAWGTWNKLAKTSDIPTTLPASDVYAWAKASVKPTYTKSEVGLSNVDNTSDANKPVSTAQQTALNLKANKIVLSSAAPVTKHAGDTWYEII